MQSLVDPLADLTSRGMLEHLGRVDVGIEGIGRLWKGAGSRGMAKDIVATK